MNTTDTDSLQVINPFELDRIFREYSDRLIDYLPRIVSAIIILAFFFLIYKITEYLVRKSMNRINIAIEIKHLTYSVIKVVILGIGVVTAASSLGMNVGSMVASIGVVSLGVSFAAKDTLENFISGITILIYQPFRVGDVIEIEGSIGTVMEINIRSTKMTTLENYVQIWPNSKMMSSRITNRRMKPSLNVVLDVGIDYEANIGKAREIIINTLAGDERILPEPEPRVLVANLGDSSIDLKIIFPVRDPGQEYAIKTDYYEKIKNALDKGGINIPFPCRTVYMKNPDKTAA